MKRKAGVIGWPVSHSLSPRLHQYWLRLYNIDGEYAAVPTEPEALAKTVKALAEQQWAGFNVTIPHKEAIIALVDDMDEVAKRIGAVNTVVISDGKLFGRNTDAYGFYENIRPHIGKKNKAVVLGAGGAARAVVAALLAQGFQEVFIANRTEERAAEVHSDRSRVKIARWEDRSQILEHTDLLVNTTSLGMAGKEALTIDLAKLPAHALVNDIVYAPLITPLLADAKSRGLHIDDGLGMLLHQAVPAFEAWFGVKPEVTDALRQYILAEK